MDIANGLEELWSCASMQLVPQMLMLMKSPSHTEESCFLHNEDKEFLQIWAWMSFEQQVRHHDYWLQPWEWTEERGEGVLYLWLVVWGVMIVCWLALTVGWEGSLSPWRCFWGMGFELGMLARLNLERVAIKEAVHLPCDAYSCHRLSPLKPQLVGGVCPFLFLVISIPIRCNNQ